MYIIDTTVSSLADDYTAELLDEFTLGKRIFPDICNKYVCHTSTIPLLKNDRYGLSLEEQSQKPWKGIS